MASKYEYLVEGPDSAPPEAVGDAWNTLRALTTAHGLPHVSRARGCFKNSLWWLLFLACLGGLVHTICMVTWQYSKFNVSVALRVEHAEHLEFPAVTICNNSPLQNSLWQAYLHTNVSDAHTTSVAVVARKRRAAGTCPAGWTNGDRGCYLVSSTQVNWYTAVSSCASYGASLTSVADETEFNFIKSLSTDVTSGVKYWIGIESNGYEWVNGTSNYLEWSSGYPNRKGPCVFMSGSNSHYWRDAPCLDTYRYTCMVTKVSSCGAGWVSSSDNNYCFYISTTTATWYGARTQCQQLGGDLVTVTSSDEQNLLSSQGGSNSYWIGFVSEWHFSDGTPTYEDDDFLWRSAGDEPDGDCCGMVDEAGETWLTVDNYWSNGFICKLPSTEPDTTIIPSTEADTTMIPTTEPDTTIIPSTEADTTMIPSTEPDTTIIPSTEPDTTVIPSTEPDTTMIPSTEADTTMLLSTEQASSSAPLFIDDVFTAVNNFIAKNITVPDSVISQPTPLTGSSYAERMATRQSFQAEESLTDILASIPAEDKSQLGYSRQDMILDCKFDGHDCYLSDFAHFNNPIHGNCYIFNSGRNQSNPVMMSHTSGKMHGLQLVLNVIQDEYVGNAEDSAGIRLLAHSQTYMPFPEDEGITLIPGSATFIGLRKVNTEFLPEPYGNCVELDKPLDKNVYAEHEPTLRYTSKSCFKTCLQRNIIQECQCASAYYPTTGSSLGIAGKTVPICETLNITQSDCLYKVTKDFEKNELTCDCPAACRQVTYETLVSTGRWPSDVSAVDTLVKFGPKIKPLFDDDKDPEKYRRNLMKVIVYYEEFSFEETYEKPAYLLTKFLADLGGSVGLWIGMSLFSMFEFFEFLMDAIVLRCSKRARSKTQRTAWA